METQLARQPSAAVDGAVSRGPAGANLQGDGAAHSPLSKGHVRQGGAGDTSDVQLTQ